QREREGAGWTPELAARALTALRIAGAYALLRPVARVAVDGGQARATSPQSSVAGQQSPVAGLRPSAANGSTNGNGVLTLRTGWPRRKKIAASGAVTARSIAREQARGLGTPRRAAVLETLDRALAQFTA